MISATDITIGSLTTNTNNEGIISMDAGAGAFDVINLGTSSNKLNSVVFAVGSGELKVHGDLFTVGDVSSATADTVSSPITVTAGGVPLTINLATLVITDNSALLNFELKRTGDIVKYKGVLDTSSVPGIDAPVVQTLLDIQSNDPTLIAARSELINLNASSISKATKDLQKERNGSLANESINATYISRNILNSRTFEVRNSSSGFASNNSANAGLAAGDSTGQESGLWGQVYGGASKYKKSGEGYYSSTGGLMFGLDKKGPSILGDKFESLNGIALSYTFLKQEDYQEKGAGGIGLNVNNNDIHSLVSTLGVKAASRFDAGAYRFIPQISALWLHNLSNSGQASTSSFIAGGSSFRSNSADLPENLVDLGLILTAFEFKGSGSDISVRYDFTSGSGFTGHTGYIQYRNLF